jgi:hypothetical protein
MTRYYLRVGHDRLHILLNSVQTWLLIVILVDYSLTALFNNNRYTRSSCPTCLLPTVTFEMRKRLLALFLPRPRQNSIALRELTSSLFMETCIVLLIGFA